MQPLKGVRVLEWAPYFPGPYLARLLGHLGADVVKVEPPTGDPARHLPPRFPDGTGFAFAASNAGKRSVVLDLKRRDDRARFLELVQAAHILVQGHRPSTAKKLGVDGPACLQKNPRLVYVGLSGWGPKGPWADRPGHDLAYQALAGCLLPHAGPPFTPPVPAADLLGAFWGATTALAALREAEATGRGRVVEVSLAGSALAGSMMQRGMALAGAPDAAPITGGWPGYDLYACKDGSIAVAILEPDWWAKFCQVVGVADLAAFPMGAARSHALAARDRVAHSLRQRTREEWMALLSAAGVPAAPVLGPEAAARAVADGGAFDPPHLADVREASAAPKLGGHQDDALRDWGTPPGRDASRARGPVGRKPRR